LLPSKEELPPVKKPTDEVKVILEPKESKESKESKERREPKEQDAKGDVHTDRQNRSVDLPSEPALEDVKRNSTPRVKAQAKDDTAEQNQIVAAIEKARAETPIDESASINWSAAFGQSDGRGRGIPSQAWVLTPARKKVTQRAENPKANVSVDQHAATSARANKHVSRAVRQERAGQPKPSKVNKLNSHYNNPNDEIGEEKEYVDERIEEEDAHEEGPRVSRPEVPEVPEAESSPQAQTAGPRILFGENLSKI
jgi:hypothetical protein